MFTCPKCEKETEFSDWDLNAVFTYLKTKAIDGGLKTISDKVAIKRLVEARKNRKEAEQLICPQHLKPVIECIRGFK